MAAPMTIRACSRLLALVAVARCSRTAVYGSFETRLKSLSVQSHVGLISSRITTQRSLDGAFQDGTGHQDNPSTPSTEIHHWDEQTNSIPINPERAHQEMLLLQKPDQPPDARILKVAIIGSPNAGKSTFINKLMGQRICSVSSKVHTTRSNALAVLTRNNTQIVLLDTPGMVSHLHGRRHQLARPLLVDPKNSLEEADIAIVLVDASNKWTNEKLSNEILMALHHHRNVRSILVLNKVDLLTTKHELFSLTAQLTEGIIASHSFALDDKTAKSLGKVETRPMLSHKYKPRLRTERDRSAPTGKSERTELVECVDTNSAEAEISSVGQTGSGDEVSGHGMSGHGMSEPQDFEVRRGDHGADVEPILTATEETQNNPSIGRVNSESISPQKVNTLEEYVSSLDGFSSNSDISESAGSSPILEEATLKEKSAKQQQRELLQEMSKRSGWGEFEAVFMISALSGEGVEDVKVRNSFKRRLGTGGTPLEGGSTGNWEYHRDVVTNLSPEEIVTEAIREKLLEHLPQEVPYNIGQKNELWTTEESGKLRIIQKIVCYKKSHESMLKRRIGRIAHEAEESLASAFHRDVHLTLTIKR